MKHNDYLAPFDYDNCAKLSAMHKWTEDLIEEISNVTMYQRAVRQMGIDENKMPVSALKKEAIMEAKGVLAEISGTIKELDELRKIGIRADYDEVQKVFVRLGKLSS